MSRQRPGPARADWADPKRLAALSHELRHTPTAGHPHIPAGPHAEPRPRDHTGRVMSAIKVTIRLSGSGTVRYFDNWKQLATYLTGEDFSDIADNVRSILINHRPNPQQ